MLYRIIVVGVPLAPPRRFGPFSPDSDVGIAPWGDAVSLGSVRISSAGQKRRTLLVKPVQSNHCRMDSHNVDYALCLDILQDPTKMKTSSVCSFLIMFDFVQKILLT